MAVLCTLGSVAQIKTFTWTLFTDLDREHTARSHLPSGLWSPQTHTRAYGAPCSLSSPLLPRHRVPPCPHHACTSSLGRGHQKWAIPRAPAARLHVSYVLALVRPLTLVLGTQSLLGG